MIKKLFTFLLFINSTIIYAQTIKTDVLVIGGSPSGVAAALQCARSKVKTVLALPDSLPGQGNSKNEMFIIEAGRNVTWGIWGEFRKQAQAFYRNTPGYDTTANAAVKFETQHEAVILKRLTDTVKNLTINYKSVFVSIRKDGAYWLANFKKEGKNIVIKASVIIDATETGEVALKAGAKSPPVFDGVNIYGPNAYRTAIAAGALWPGEHFDHADVPTEGYPLFPVYFIPVRAFILPDVGNILVTEKLLPADKNIQYLPLQLTAGQGAGTIAAYCAFFKTNTTALKVRLIQGELLDFKGNLLPFEDMPVTDPAWRAVQQVCATGLLKGMQQIGTNKTTFLFGPDLVVNTNEIKPVLTEIYTRAFLWFNKENATEHFTVGNTLSLISDYTLTDPAILQATLKNNWKTLYKFLLDFDLKRPITRREFAVLINRYLNPFARTVDLSGKLVN